MTMERTGFLSRSARQALAAIGAFAILSGAAAAVEPPAPRPGEIRLTLKLNERSVSFMSTLEPLLRRTIAFEGRDYAPTDAMRAAVAELHAALPAIEPAKGLVITAYAADPVVAYRRARAVRGELIERHKFAAGSIVAAGRAAQGHGGGATIVDVHVVDTAGCTGCGPTPFRAIAFDSGTMRLVTALPEMLAARPRPEAEGVAAAASPAQSTAPVAPSGAPKPRSVVQAPPKAPAGAPRDVMAAPKAAAPAGRIVPARRAVDERPTASPLPAGGGCARPHVIIDDYYPGGPLVPCRSRPPGRNS